MGYPVVVLILTFMNRSYTIVALIALIVAGFAPFVTRASESVDPWYGYDNTYEFYDDSSAWYSYDNTYSFYDDAYYGYDNTYSFYDDYTEPYYGYDNTYSYYDDYTEPYYGYDNTYSYYDDYTEPYYGYDNTYVYYPTYNEPYYGYDNTYVYEPYYNDYGYSYNDPYYNEPYYNQPYGDYVREYSYVYNDYWYETPRYNDRPKDRPRYDEPTCLLEVSDKTPDEGDYITLTWDVDDADEATLTGFGDVNPRGGSERIRVNNDRTFTLRVEGRGGSDTCSISVRVDEEEEEDDLWCELKASPRTVEEGDRVRLTWDTRGDVRDARINNGVGSVDEDGGSEYVYPTRDTRYTLTIEDRDGDEEECSTTVDVEDGLAPPPDVPLVYLSQLPYTGAGDGPMYWILLMTGAGLLGYGLFFRALPFAYARAKMFRSDAETPVVNDEGTPAVPQNVTRQDVRAFVSALAEGDAVSAREFARAGGEVLFSEAAVILDDVVRSRENGSTADPMVKEVTKTWDASKFETLIEAFANAKDESVVEKALA